MHPAILFKLTGSDYMEDDAAFIADMKMYPDSTTSQNL